MSELLSKDAVLAAMDKPSIATKDVHVPELGGTLRVREMSGSLRNRFEATGATLRNGGDSKSLDTVTAQMVAACTVDERGTPMFTVNEIKRLVAAHPKAVFRLRDAIIDISGTSDSDVEEMAEVFGDARSEPSSSG
jgi:hypothetical protein